MNNPLENYFDIICGDLPRDKLVSVILPDDQLELLAVMMDVEMDPMRVTFDRNKGDAVLHAAGQKWHMLSAAQLRTLAGLSERAQAIWERWHNGEDHLYKWLAMGDSGIDMRRRRP
ncbi:hypothetical protein [Pararhodobacter sp.]|uniref:hypothetical protein n=1 Tax=Pararhodobacter sp. TaxID=2127056 RepID=UPI002FDEFD01